MTDADTASDVAWPAGQPSAALRVMRRLIGGLEWLLRLLVLERRLPSVKARLRDLPYGSHEKQRLDLLVPPGDGPFPLVVYVHGGAWVTGDKSSFAWITHAIARGGLLVASVNYRWAPEASFAEQLRDVAQAIAWARSHAREHGGDPDAVFLAGDSAGAHLVAWLHVAMRQPALLEAVGVAPPLAAEAHRGAILLYGIYDLATAWELGLPMRTPIRSLLGAPPSEAPRLAALASPLRHVVPGLPPALVSAGERDPLCGQSMALLEALRLAGVPSRPLLLDRERHPDAGHSFINFGGRGASKAVLRAALEFIGERTGRPSPPPP